jgi:hypothetical protein
LLGLMLTNVFLVLLMDRFISGKPINAPKLNNVIQEQLVMYIVERINLLLEERIIQLSFGMINGRKRHLLR